MISAVSIRQPFASLILAGVKRYEARSWYPSQNGWLLLHASGNFGLSNEELRASPLIAKAFTKANLPPDRKAWSRSAILGAFEVTGILQPPFTARQLTALDKELSGDDPDVLWKIGKRITFDEPIPCHGKLGLFSPPAAAIAAARQYLSF